jgi:A/G-specific adenine glycosylase
MAKFNFAQALLKWHTQFGRHDLPWQLPRTPYRVWVSEIMLQQTQVATVINYFENFLEVFPTLKDLAKAPSKKVMQHWAGLGYYTRARNLHKSAQICLENYNAELPLHYDQLIALPGIGRSTAGAILSQAHGKAFAILDGNVKRVLIRFHAINGDTNSSLVIKQLWQLSESHLPKNNLANYTQAIMDLGASICTRSKPRCSECPIKQHCQAFQSNCVEQFPNKKITKQIPKRELYALIILNARNEILLEQRPSKGIWGGLFSLPEASDSALGHELASQFITLNQVTALSSFKHVFSHFQLTIHPLMWQNSTPKLQIRDNNQYQWVNRNQLTQIGLPAPIKKLLQGLP